MQTKSKKPESIFFPCAFCFLGSFRLGKKVFADEFNINFWPVLNLVLMTEFLFWKCGSWWGFGSFGYGVFIDLANIYDRWLLLINFVTGNERTKRSWAKWKYFMVEVWLKIASSLSSTHTLLFLATTTPTTASSYSHPLKPPTSRQVCDRMLMHGAQKKKNRATLALGYSSVPWVVWDFHNRDSLEQEQSLQ